MKNKDEFLFYMANNMETIMCTSVPPMIYSTFIISILAYLENINKKDEIKNKKEINNLLLNYKEFISKYAYMIKELKLTNPIDIYLLNNYLLYNGYLSYNKTFERTINSNYIDRSKTLGAEIINGKAICRHLSSFLKDLYKELGYISYILTVYAEARITKLVETKQTNDDTLEKEIDKKVLDIRYKKYLLENLKERKYSKVETKIVKDEEELKIAKILGNHVITVVNYQNTPYFLDPTNKYILNLSKPFLLTSKFDDRFYPKLALSYILNDTKNPFKITNLINKTSIVTDEEERTKEMEKLISSNKKLFEEFYLNNLELYQNIVKELDYSRKLKN